MALRSDFDRAALAAVEGISKNATHKAAKKRLAPFSIRLTPEERAALVHEAQGRPLGSYIKAKLGKNPPPAPRKRITVDDRKALAQVLALLGKSDLCDNLSEMCKAASIGALPVTPELEVELRKGLHEVSTMHSLVMMALGWKSGFTR